MLGRAADGRLLSFSGQLAKPVFYDSIADLIPWSRNLSVMDANSFYGLSKFVQPQYVAQVAHAVLLTEWRADRGHRGANEQNTCRVSMDTGWYSKPVMSV
jgi:hypothetical protein